MLIFRTNTIVINFGDIMLNNTPMKIKSQKHHCNTIVKFTYHTSVLREKKTARWVTQWLQNIFIKNKAYLLFIISHRGPYTCRNMIYASINNFFCFSFSAGHMMQTHETISPFQERCVITRAGTRNSVIDFPGFCFKHIVFSLILMLKNIK